MIFLFKTYLIHQLFLWMPPTFRISFLGDLPICLLSLFIYLSIYLSIYLFIYLSVANLLNIDICCQSSICCQLFDRLTHICFSRPLNVDIVWFGDAPFILLVILMTHTFPFLIGSTACLPVCLPACLLSFSVTDTSIATQGKNCLWDSWYIWYLPFSVKIMPTSWLR